MGGEVGTSLQSWPKANVLRVAHAGCLLPSPSSSSAGQEEIGEVLPAQCFLDQRRSKLGRKKLAPCTSQETVSVLEELFRDFQPLQNKGCWVAALHTNILPGMLPAKAFRFLSALLERSLQEGPRRSSWLSL